MEQLSRRGLVRGPTAIANGPLQNWECTLDQPMGREGERKGAFLQRLIEELLEVAEASLGDRIWSGLPRQESMPAGEENALAPHLLSLRCVS